jgi:hypothetical protein
MGGTDHPLLLHPGPCIGHQHDTLKNMVADKLAAVVHLDGFDFALIPHINKKNGLHIVGLKVGHVPQPLLSRLSRFEVPVVVMGFSLPTLFSVAPLTCAVSNGRLMCSINFFWCRLKDLPVLPVGTMVGGL